MHKYVLSLAIIGIAPADISRAPVLINNAVGACLATIPYRPVLESCYTFSSPFVGILNAARYGLTLLLAALQRSCILLHILDALKRQGHVGLAQSVD